jgi:hypothetical protein
MERSHLERNARDRERLRDLVARLDDEALQRPLDGPWTVAATLAHLAFWDRWVQARWDRYERDGAIEDLPDGVIELANAAGLPQWLALAPRRAAEQALAAAEEGDRRIARLAPEAVRHAMATGRRSMLDRSLHREPHLDEIERQLAAAPRPGGRAPVRAPGD